MPNQTQLLDNHIDDHVDEVLRKCFAKDQKKSFFMSAGAGSGKTRTLINILSFLDAEMGKELISHGKRIAVITYTNAACDEILKRLQYKPVFVVSTIHSFLWELIKNYQNDIKEWIVQSIGEEISELEAKQTKGRSGVASDTRADKIKRKKDRLEKINLVRRFSYNPNGQNQGYDSLSHAEVIKMGSSFLACEETMQEILVRKYPILLIDECQDTKKELVDALFSVFKRFKADFILGMFGDTMQKIYTDGKENLSSEIPDDWEKPVKKMNHRSTKRIVRLANKIRSTIDDQHQEARSDADEGILRIFLASSNSKKDDVEKQVAEKMSSESGDSNWHTSDKYKSLILEHHMAANRCGFSELYSIIDESGVYDTALKDGSIPELSFLANTVLPLVLALRNKDDFEVSKIVRLNSPLLGKKILNNKAQHQIDLLEKVNQAVENLNALWDDGRNPTCLDVFRFIKNTNLFEYPSRIEDILATPVDGEDSKTTVLRNALEIPFSQLEKYSAYVSNATNFVTHQGVKGLEFPRVMIIIDDSEARGFLFSYEKLFGAKSKTETDIRNENEGKDTSIKRTTRLFYVACTRAKESLAVVIYTDNKEAVTETLISNSWFSQDEIIDLS